MLFPLQKLVRSPTTSFVVSIALIFIVTIAKIYIIPDVGSNTPFLLYFGIVLFISRYGNLYSAVFCSVLAAIFANYFFIYPENGVFINRSSFFQTLLFLIECSICIGISNSSRTAVKRIKRNEAKVKALMANSVEVITTSNGKGKITFVNETIKKVLGYTPRQYYQINGYTLLHPDEKEEVTQKITACLQKDGSSITFKHRLKHKTGEFKWVETKLINLFHLSEVQGLVANFRDITQEVLFDKYRDSFIGIASHELKTPISTVKGYLQIMQRIVKKSGNTSLDEFLLKGVEQIERMTRLVHQLLNVSTINEGMFVLQLSRFSVKEILDDCLKHISLPDNEFEVNVSGNWDVIIEADKNKIEQVFINLISNAIKYSDTHTQILIEVHQIAPSMLEVKVIDFGVGIPADSLEYIFKRFYRVSHSSANFEGYGLGLFIAREIIKKHGGDIKVESEPGKGSTFSFTLPVKAIAANNENTSTLRFPDAS